MKNKIMENWKKLTVLVSGYLVTMWANTYFVLCSTIWDDIETVSSNTQTQLVSAAKALLPLVIIIDIICIIFTRDQKKLSAEIGILVASIIGFIAMLLVDKGTLVNTLTNLVG